MGHTLKNENLEIQIDFPLESYGFSRFDWTGKITGVKFNTIQLASIEDPNCENENLFGKGFYNEFGIDTALGFDEAKIGQWFHKIGVGLLKKEDSSYDFNTPYIIKPADFQVNANSASVLITCISDAFNGYSYQLRKEIELQETGFSITYHLKNTGEKTIRTDEYIHNFIGIDTDFIGENYSLEFPFDLKPELFGENVNPDVAVAIGNNHVHFNCTPSKQFFFSNLTGSQWVNASWELVHRKTKIRLRESVDFQTKKVNLWGWRHVISPELFFDINIASGESTTWTRTYEVFHI